MKAKAALTPGQDASGTLFDFVNKTYGFRNDAALACALEVAPPVISKIRNGHMHVGPTLIVIFLEFFEGLKLADIRAHLAAKPAQRATVPVCSTERLAA